MFGDVPLMAAISNAARDVTIGPTSQRSSGLSLCWLDTAM
jgi:hypothetical protein